MRKGEVGQALLWVLIILGVGVLILYPGLGLAYASLKVSQINTQNVRSLYLAEAAQEYALWQLSYNNLAADMNNSGDNATLHVEICGNSADVLVVLRAVETQGAVAFATHHVIKPTVTVYPDEVPNNIFTEYTFDITLEQLSDNTTQGLDAIYHMLPKGFEDEDYVVGSSYIRYGNGPWESVGDPFMEEVSSQQRLLWPATYVWDEDTETGTGGFTSPFRDFQVREIKHLKFSFNAELPKNETHASWTVLKPWDTLSGATALIIVGNPSDPDVFQGGMVQSFATTNPEVIQPDQYVEVDYTIHMTNYDGETLKIEQIMAWLPTEFTYTENTTSGLITDNPELTLEETGGVERWFMHWDDLNESIASSEELLLTFNTSTLIDDSGTYFVEVMVIPDKPVPTILDEVGITREEYVANYSWNTGGIVVPHYDSQATAGEVVIDTNIGFGSGILQILSWHLE